MATTWDEIQSMNDEQIAALNKKLAKKLVLTRIVLPVAVAVAAHVAVGLVIKKLDNNSTES